MKKVPRQKRRKRLVSLVLPGLLGSCAGCALITDRLVEKEIRTAPRNPESGILLEAEPRDLGPEDASGAVLFIHGFLGAGQNFADLPERVAEQGWRVRVMLLPGHGTTPRQLESVSAEELLQAVLEEVDEFRSKYKSLVLVGHSMGGTLAVLATSQRDVQRLVLAAPYFGITHHWYYLLRPERWVRIGYPLCRWVYKGQLFVQVNRPEAKDDILSYSWVPVRSGRTLLELAKRANDPRVLGKITCPVLLIHSSGDVAASPEAARRAFEEIPSKDKRALWLERSNHHLFFDYDREQVMAETLAFIGACQ